MENINNTNVNSKEDLQKQINEIKETVAMLKGNEQEIKMFIDVAEKEIENIKSTVSTTNVNVSNVCGVVETHTDNQDNPHMVTKEQVGLGNVDNTGDLNKPISSATQTALNGKLNTSIYTAADVLSKMKTVDGSGSGLDADLLDGKNASNAANSIPVLDGAGKLPIAQLPTGATATTVSLGNHAHSNYAVNGHGHSYLPLTGGTVTGVTNFNGALNKKGYPVPAYDSGTWTPKAEAGLTKLEFNAPSCKWFRTGNLVYAQFDGVMDFNNQSVIIGGLPFTNTDKGIATVGYAEYDPVFDGWAVSGGKLRKMRYMISGRHGMFITMIYPINNPI